MLVATALASTWLCWTLQDCWSERERNATGYIVPDYEKFPNGISGVAKKVHDLGLKIGIYRWMPCSAFLGYRPHTLRQWRRPSDMRFVSRIPWIWRKGRRDIRRMGYRLYVLTSAFQTFTERNSSTDLKYGLYHAICLPICMILTLQ